MKLWCSKCRHLFKGKVGRTLCDNCKIEKYNNLREKPMPEEETPIEEESSKGEPSEEEV